MADPVGREPEPAGTLRRSLLVLAGVATAGAAAELLMLRHWGGVEQLIPWAVLGLMAAAIAVVACCPSRSRVRAVRVAASITLLSGVYGMVEHAVGNYDVAPLDADYGPRWSTMGELDRWWAAATGGVGPSPLLAPAVLTLIGLCLLFATVAHPALRGRDEPAGATSA
jgi:hypothetical protein